MADKFPEIEGFSAEGGDIRAQERALGIGLDDDWGEEDDFKGAKESTSAKTSPVEATARSSEDRNTSFMDSIHRDDEQQTHPHVSVTENDAEVEAFERQFPEVETEPEPTPAPISTGGGVYMPDNSYNNNMFTQPTPEPEQDSEAIKEWRARQAEEIERRDRISAEKREETRAAAERAIDEFYQKYNEDKKSTIKRNKEEEADEKKSRDEWLSQGTTWGRISDLVDLKDSRSKTNTRAGRDVSRMKEVLLSLRKEGETAPGACY